MAVRPERRFGSGLAALLLAVGCGDGGGGAEVSDAGPADAAADAGPDAAAPDGRVPDGAAPADAGPADAAPPADAAVPEATRVWVGVNEIPEDMLGTVPGTWNDRPVTFRWALSPDGWTIEVHVESRGGWAPSAPPYLLWRFVSAAHPPVVIEPDHVEPPGGRWTAVEGGHVWQGRVTRAPTMEPGDCTLQAKVDDVLSAALPLSVAALTPEADPFEEIDPWVVTFGRDLGALRVEYADEAYAVLTDAPGMPDGTPDFEEALAAIGLLGGDDAWRAAVVDLVRARMRAHLHAFFFLGPDGDPIDEDSVRIRLRFEGDPDVPPPESWSAQGWSRIAVGGDDPAPDEDRAFFGRAALDWNNAAVDDDTTPDRGVFTTSFVRFMLTSPFTVPLLVDYTPASGGRPFGSEPGDAAFLAPDFDPAALPSGPQQARAHRFRLVVDYLSLALAAVTAHEIGHSLGLVKPGPPPRGLLAGVDGPWVEAAVAGAHVDTAGLNLMQSGRSFRAADALEGRPRFNAPNLAYLRRRLVVLPD